MGVDRVRFENPVLVFDLEDRYARDRNVRGPNPRPMGLMTFDVIGGVRDGTVDLFDTALRLFVVRNDGGYYVSFGDVGQSRDVRLRDALAPGAYKLRIMSLPHFYQPIDIDVRVHADEEIRGNRLHFVNLEPGHAYPFPVESTVSGGAGPTLLRGSIRRTDGSPVVGARIQEVADAANPFMTDETGEWVLVFPDEYPTGNVSLRLTLPSNNGSDVLTITNVLVAQGRTSSLRQTGIRGQVVDVGDVGIPDAVIRVNGRQGQAESSADGLWTYYFLLNEFPLDGTETMVDVTVTHPDGRTLAQSNVGVTAREVSTVPTFRFH